MRLKTQSDMTVGQRIKTLAEMIRELSEQLVIKVSKQQAEEIRQRIKGVDVNGNPGNNQEAGE